MPFLTRFICHVASGQVTSIPTPSAYDQVQRSTLGRPKFSVNRTPIDLEFQSQTDLDKEKEEEGGTETDDKDSIEGRVNSMNSSKVRLTGGKGA